MMLRKPYIRIRILISTLIWFGLMLSTLAMIPNQAVVTSTPEPTVAYTESTTSTPTATRAPTSTPSPSATPTYSIPEPLQTEFANVNEKLDRLAPNPGRENLTSFLINLASSGVWHLLLWAASFFGAAKLISKFINNQNKLNKKNPNTTLVNLENLFGDIFKLFTWLLLGLLLLQIVYYLGNSIGYSNNNSEVVAISTQLNQIQTQLNVLSNTTATITPNANSAAIPHYPTIIATSSSDNELQISLAKSLGILGAFLFFYLALASIISRNQTKIYENTIPKLKMDILSRKLLPAIFLVLILQLLPSPIDTFLLPILIPFFLFAFFDIVIVYPNSHLQNVAKRYYAEIIFWSVFVVWLRALQELQRYFNLFWNKFGNFASSILTEFFRTQENPVPFILSNQSWEQILGNFIMYGWFVLPYLLALIFTSPPSRKIRKIAEEKYIEKISKTGESKGE